MKKLFLLTLLCSTFSCLAVDVIVNPANTSTLDENEIKQIFIGKSKSFSDGSKALPITQADGAAVTDEFNEKVLNKSSSQLKAYWSKLVFTGKGTPPKEAADDAEVLKLVASNPNLIGFVSSGAADGSVKVVKSF
ncbi:phosphate ABC transporter substrate-binding protein [Pseudoalteromonas piscicida]|uniref:Phosphate ABC transporter substrate-binding protein n=1 Tax=Pseudoalteromonas piscicida TaxID=43662 RepID=A0AAD0RJ00_PSEO7|nr:phosphate ABC transporter substrate-binding protein [Pseudoalteromonas piscicida]ASD66770.1 phosphate ABC transporter substrate-binding protein [Pseudoalteromonas piscicida]AXQ97701.1 phosphate ABC transporter substrate-binding protein [Pseudoalteromonas piscicida]AXR02515.1 phosphate ABC transporter substrate-binding protein [Pseudoalteromonas piscicida]